MAFADKAQYILLLLGSKILMLCLREFTFMNIMPPTSHPFVDTMVIIFKDLFLPAMLLASSFFFKMSATESTFICQY